jgi:hypothetical protein
MAIAAQYPTEAMLGYTTTLERGSTADAATAVFTQVGEVTDLTVFDASRDTVEVTNHRSPGFALEFIPGLIDFGSASFELNWVPARPITEDLMNDFQSAGNRAWRITLPDLTEISFLGALSSINATAPVKDVMKLSCEIKLSGPPDIDTTNSTYTP